MVDNIYAPPSYDFRRQSILDRFGVDLNNLATNFQRAVASYTYWYKILLQQTSLIFRIENEPRELSDCLLRVDSAELSRMIAGKQLEADPGRVNANKPYKRVVRQKIDPDPSDWLSLPDSLRDEFAATSQSLGYSIPHHLLFAETDAISKTEGNASGDALLDIPTSGLERRFLAPSGWALSSAKQQPLDSSGGILPWFTYAAIKHNTYPSPFDTFSGSKNISNDLNESLISLNNENDINDDKHHSTRRSSGCCSCLSRKQSLAVIVIIFALLPIFFIYIISAAMAWVRGTTVSDSNASLEKS
jgi:hypothetical protein